MKKTYLVRMVRTGVFYADVMVEAESFGQAETMATSRVKDKNFGIEWLPDGDLEVEIGQIVIESE